MGNVQRINLINISKVEIRLKSDDISNYKIVELGDIIL